MKLLTPARVFVLILETLKWITRRSIISNTYFLYFKHCLNIFSTTAVNYDTKSLVTDHTKEIEAKNIIEHTHITI